MRNTERLILRGADPKDAEQFGVIRNSSFVLKYNAMEKLDEAGVTRELDRCCESENAFFLERREDGALIGAVFAEADEMRWGVEARSLAFYLGEQYSRRGYMKEALRSVLEDLFDNDAIKVISARAFSENTASRRLLESLGFVQEGYLRRCVLGWGGIVYDDVVFSLLREEYRP